MALYFLACFFAFFLIKSSIYHLAERIQVDKYKISRLLLTYLLLNLVFDSLNIIFCQSIFHSYKLKACFLNWTLLLGYITLHYFLLLY